VPDEPRAGYHLVRRMHSSAPIAEHRRCRGSGLAVLAGDACDVHL